MPNGFRNRVLHVNSSDGEIRLEELGERFFRTYLGGSALIAYYLPMKTEPLGNLLSPVNALILATGVLTGAPVGGSGRNAVGCAGRKHTSVPQQDPRARVN